jgi:nucleoside-diphosphate-sugar epimerase
MRTVLITGASGFVGSHIVEALHSRGIGVRCLVRRTSSLDFIASLQPELAFGDVTLPATLAPALEGAEAVVHCAGLTKASFSRDYFRVNEEGCRNLYAACMDIRPRLARIVHIGSLAAFGPAAEGRPITEESPPRPVSDYGRSKLAGQRIAEEYSRHLPISIVIPPAVYGPRDRDFLAYFRLANRGIMLFIGRAGRHMSLIYARDLAEAVARVLLSESTAGRTYIVDDGSVQSWMSMAETIGRAMGKTPHHVYIPAVAAKGAGVIGNLMGKLRGRPVLLNGQKVKELLQSTWVCSSDRIRRELGFRAAYPLEEGIRETLAWYREHQWL